MKKVKVNRELVLNNVFCAEPFYFILAISTLILEFYFFFSWNFIYMLTFNLEISTLILKF